MTRQQQIEIEAAAFRGLVEHLRRRSNVQKIDLMNLAGFCRNCLAKCYRVYSVAHPVTFRMGDGVH
jgi:hypothetical protein